MGTLVDVSGLPSKQRLKLAEDSKGNKGREETVRCKRQQRGNSQVQKATERQQSGAKGNKETKVRCKRQQRDNSQVQKATKATVRCRWLTRWLLLHTFPLTGHEGPGQLLMLSLPQPGSSRAAHKRPQPGQICLVPCLVCSLSPHLSVSLCLSVSVSLCVWYAQVCVCIRVYLCGA